MNLTNSKYSNIALVKEMFETAKVIENFDPQKIEKLLNGKNVAHKILLTGEGSSRIFPAKRAITSLNKIKSDYTYFTEGATQALEYDLSETTVFGASNSGKTKELVNLFNKIKKEGHNSFFGITANGNTPVVGVPVGGLVLSCGPEAAVAATKSVVEQALVYHALTAHLLKKPMSGMKECGEKLEQALKIEIPSSITKILAEAPYYYFAGRNNGVAEELALKTNEIARKKSSYLEGTILLHGIEEVMREKEVIIVVDPFPSEEEKMEEHLVKGAKVNVVAISSRQTRFPTVIIPKMEGWDEYIQLAAGWNLLVEAGLELKINLDKPERARKIGNEFNVNAN